MKALSIHSRFAFEILTGKKKEEYRTWTTKYRGDLLICSTAKQELGYISGHALCVATLQNITQTSDGTFAWQLTNIRPIVPFQVSGKRRLYEVDDQLIRYPKSHAQSKTSSSTIPEDTWQKYYLPLIYTK